MRAAIAQRRDRSSSAPGGSQERWRPDLPRPATRPAGDASADVSCSGPQSRAQAEEPGPLHAGDRRLSQSDLDALILYVMSLQ
jgi:hypothetical protein